MNRLYTLKFNGGYVIKERKFHMIIKKTKDSGNECGEITIYHDNGMVMNKKISLDLLYSFSINPSNLILLIKSNYLFQNVNKESQNYILNFVEDNYQLFAPYFLI